MEGGHRAVGERFEKREMDEIDVEVQDVELERVLADVVEHGQVRGQVGLERRRIEPDCLIALGDEARRGARLGAREEGHIVTEIDKRVGEVRDDSLRASVETRRHRLVERSDERNPQSLRPVARGLSSGREAERSPRSRSIRVLV